MTHARPVDAVGVVPVPGDHGGGGGLCTYTHEPPAKLETGAVPLSRVLCTLRRITSSCQVHTRPKIGEGSHDETNRTTTVF